MKRNNVIYGLALGMLIGLAACDDKGEQYKQFLKTGGAIYPGRPDSVNTLPGNGRLVLSWWLTADPMIKNVQIFWNNRRDSLNVTVDNKGEPQQMEVLIDNLEEAKYAFEIFTYDANGNRSIGVDALGEVFGERYEALLTNRPIDAVRLMEGTAYITWSGNLGNADAGLIVGSEVHYVDAAGKEVRVRVPTTVHETVITDIEPGNQLQYRTLYLPDAAAIDTFYSAFETKELPSYAELDKRKFTKIVLPTDNPTIYNASYPMENLWDGTTTNFYYTGANSGVPTWFSVDLGRTVQLRKLLYQQRIDPESVIWANANPRYFELWGTADTPHPDGRWEGWTKLLDVASVKPSGLPLGQHSDEDMMLALNGETFILPTGIPAVRYIRIKVNETWGNTQHVHIGELTFWE